MMNRALLLIDIQNDYFSGGNMELEHSEHAADAAAALLRVFREKTLPVIHIQHVSTRHGSSLLLPDTEGVAIHAKVAPVQGEMVFTKHFPNAFRDTPLKEHLEHLGITQLVVAGMMTHMCVDTTVRAAFDLGFFCLLAHDACATRALRFHGTVVPAGQVQAVFMAALGGTFAEVRSTADISGEVTLSV